MAQHVGAPRETFDDLRLELAELRASRKRFVLAATADRRGLERDLHNGVQQHLVALAVNLQLAAQTAEADPEATKAILEDMQLDVRQALKETAQLAERIYPQVSEPGGFAAALRSVAARASTPVFVDVAAGGRYPPEVTTTVYLCCREALEHLPPDAQATIRVREEEGTIAFEVVEEGGRADSAGTTVAAALEQLRDRVEALDGRLTIRSEPGGRLCVSGSLPLAG
jgi:signal transduction histidine kinase